MKKILDEMDKKEPVSIKELHENIFSQDTGVNRMYPPDPFYLALIRLLSKGSIKIENKNPEILFYR
jgi:hypothetical protein